MLTRFRYKYEPSLIFATNMDKVDLQDDLRSTSTLQSAVKCTHARRKKLNFHRKYEAYNIGKNGLAESRIQMVENRYKNTANTA